MRRACAIQLTICAAGGRIRIDGMPSLLVCGRAPGHEGKHHDVDWAVEWADPEVTS
jgi:hypothetical protein